MGCVTEFFGTRLSVFMTFVCGLTQVVLGFLLLVGLGCWVIGEEMEKEKKMLVVTEAPKHTQGKTSDNFK
jgi:putative Mn2+ efflux pump MntP